MAIALVSALSAYADHIHKNVTDGNLLVFIGSGTQENTPVSSGVATTSAWTEVDYAYETVFNNICVWWAKCTGSGELIVTCSGSDQSMSLHEYSGANTEDPVDQHDTTVLTGPTVDDRISVPLTGVADGAVIVMGVGEEADPQTLLATAPFTRQTLESGACHATSDYIVPNAGDYTPEMTLQSGQDRALAAVAASFLEEDEDECTVEVVVDIIQVDMVITTTTVVME